jgi:polysaccharide export outer membrane protein
MLAHNPIRQFAIPLVLALLTCNMEAQRITTNETGAISLSPSIVDAQTSMGASQFTLGAADVIHINVWKNADLSQTVTVGPDGFVSLPLLGDVHVAGMTTNQMAQLITLRLSSYVVSAQVTVSVIDVRSRQVYVMGQVGKPGGYPLVAPLTVLQVLAEAGGLNTFANRKGIFILRGSNGDTQRLKFNYTNAIHGDVKQNISLKPGDTVIVP